LAKQKEWGQPPSSKTIVSPGQLEARFRIKRSTEWIGYQAHLTETCDHDHPRLITQVETTVATFQDSKVTATIQEDLSQRELLPEIQFVNERYTETDLLVSSRLCFTFTEKCCFIPIFIKKS
jgi:transposase